jgi:hypothetical protein
MPRSGRTAWRVVMSAFVLLTLPACLLVVSTSPSTFTGGTIVFVAIDDRGVLVASLAVSVTDIDGRWHSEGMTASDGAFRCVVAEGVSRVRAGVSLPPGFALGQSDRWPREIDVPSDGNVEIQIRVRVAGSP